MTQETTKKKEEALQFKNVVVERSGDRIVLPENMSLREGRKWLELQEEAEEQEIAIHEEIEAFPYEGAYAFAKAIATTYGFAKQMSIPRGFWGEDPPRMISVEVGLNTHQQIPWGRIKVPTISGYLQTGIVLKGNRFLFCIDGKVKTKDKEAVAKLANLTRHLVVNESIYRGRAIRVEFPQDLNNLDPAYAPQFLDTQKTNPDELIFSESLQQEITTSLLTPIMKTNICRAHKIPLKRGVLLSGPFGTGKTLTSAVVAKRCEEHGWTFIYLKNVGDLQQAIHFAKAYQPAVIFAEDIDRVMTPDEDEASGRTEAMNDILNTIDGVDTKGMELLVVLTTNHLDTIEKAMVRPGRLDAIINVDPPDAGAVVKLIQLYARGRLAPGGDFSEVGETLSGQIPAIIRETIERSKLSAISRLNPNEDLLLYPQDLLFAAKEMLRHAALMQPEAEDERSDLEKAASILADSVSDAMRGTTNGSSGVTKPNGQSDNKRSSATA